MTRCRALIAAGGLAAMLPLVDASLAQTPTISDLPKSNRCTARAPMVYPGGPPMQTTMQVGSAGGWCWFDVWGTLGSIRIVPQYTVKRAPTHGEIVMGEVNQKARIAYRPESGFVGVDTFVIVNAMTNSERPVTVTVLK